LVGFGDFNRRLGGGPDDPPFTYGGAEDEKLVGEGVVGGAYAPFELKKMVVEGVEGYVGVDGLHGVSPWCVVRLSCLK
jgi:hypothetical protein